MRPIFHRLVFASCLLLSASAVAQEVATETVDTDAVDTDAVDTEAVDTEAVDTETVEADPEPQPAHADAVEAESVEADPEPQPAHADAVEAESVEADPEPQPADEAPARPSGPALTFANSFFSWTNAATLHTFAPAAQLTYNPTYVMSFSLTPRFYLTDTTFLWLNQAMALELTDTNSGAHNREPRLSDTLLDLRQIVQWEGFVFAGQARLGFPSSKASQAAGRVLQTGLGLTVTRPFPEASGFTIAATVGYRRWWATRNVANAVETYPGLCAQSDPGEAPRCSQASGVTTARDILLGGLIMNLAPLPGLTVSFSGFFMSTYNHDVGSAGVDVNGGAVHFSDDSPTHWRSFTYFSLAVAYDVLPWLNLQLGIQNAGSVAPLFDPSGNARSPLSPDTQVFLTTTFGIDALIGEVVSGDDETLTPEERQRRRQGLASTGGRPAF